jgi:hypothetical protein
LKLDNRYTGPRKGKGIIKYIRIALHDPMLVAIIDGAKIRKACGEMQMVSVCPYISNSSPPHLAAYLHIVPHKKRRYDRAIERCAGPRGGI